MAAVEGGAGFWLPSEFFDDSLILNNKHKNSASDSDFCFPKEFPYDFHPEIAPQFEKRWAMSTSPQSTLTHARRWSGSSNGSPNGVYSPPTTLLGAEIDAVGDLFHRAAGEIPKLKLNNTDTHDPTQHEVFMVPPRPQNQFNPAPKNFNQAFIQNIYLQQQIMKQKNQGSRLWYQIRNGMPVGGLIGQEGWSIKHSPGSGAAGEVLGGSRGCAAAKRVRAGTGVFLPRRYGSGFDSHADSRDSSRKKTERNLHAFNNTSGFAQSHPKCGSRGIISDFDLLMARRNALMLQQQRRRSSLLEQSSQMSCGIGGGVCLPQDWTY